MSLKSKNLHVLVVDDEKNICITLEYFFSSIGHKVKAVGNGMEAMNLIKKKKFDIVLCDLTMPEVSGYDLIKAMNNLKVRPKLGIITGRDEKLEHFEDNGLEIDFILKKPFGF